MTRLNRGVSTFLAFSLLLLQALLPWAAPRFLTQDGPSHLYNARVIAKLLFTHPSPYETFYQFRPAISTNWSTVLLFNLASLISVRRAEALVATFSVVIVFLCFTYLMRSVEPTAAWSPLVNFLCATWFLWAGFYNFYLGAGLFALVVGYFLRHGESLTWPQAARLSLLLVGLFFTHVLPAALALLVIGILAIQMPARHWVRWCTVVGPTSALVLAFLAGNRGRSALNFEFFRDWFTTPSRVFSNWYGPIPLNQWLLPAVTLAILAGTVRALGRPRTKTFALSLATLTCLLLYLFLPSRGFGGEEINLRLAWILFVLGGALATPLLERYSGWVAIVTTAFLAPFLVHAIQIQIRDVNDAVVAYEEMTKEIPAGATMITAHYRPGYIDRAYGYKGLSFEPLYHADSWLAADRGFVVLSDYQALSKVFPLEPRAPITDLQRADLWALEGASPDAARALKAILASFPYPIDYVAVMGDTDLQPDGMDLVAAAKTRGFLRLYRRR